MSLGSLLRTLSQFASVTLTWIPFGLWIDDMFHFF